MLKVKTIAILDILENIVIGSRSKAFRKLDIVIVLNIVTTTIVVVSIVLIYNSLVFLGSL